MAELALDQTAEVRHKRVVAQMRLLTIELALRCYQAEQGHAPTGLKQLVSNYLQRVPMDPFSGRPIIYRPRGTTWLLYSVGEDGADDGGIPIPRSVSGHCHTRRPVLRFTLVERRLKLFSSR